MARNVFRFWLLLLVVLLSFTTVLQVSADTPLITIVYEPPSDLLVPLMAELRLVGFDPLPQKTVQGHETIFTLQKTAKSVGAAAVVRILKSDKGVMVLILDPNSEVHVSTEVRPSEKSERVDTVIALKTVEILRAGLMKIKNEALQPIDASSPPKAVSSSPAPDSSSGRTMTTSTTVEPIPDRQGLFFNVAPSATYGFGDIPASLHVVVGLSLSTLKRLRLAINGRIPTVASKIESSNGSATIREGMIAMGIFSDLRSPANKLIPFVGLLGSVQLFSVTGNAEDPFTGKSKLEVSGGIHLDAGAAVHLNHFIAIRTDLCIGIVVPRPVVRFDGHVIGSFGRPVFSGMIGLELKVY